MGRRTWGFVMCLILALMALSVSGANAAGKKTVLLNYSTLHSIGE
jgi:hypothetical protein